MNTFPLVRTKWSNEHIMAAAFAVLILYHLPKWVEDSKEIVSFFLLLLGGILLDVILNRIRFGRIWCPASASITVAMISVLTFGVPLLGRALGVAVALFWGKHIWGGTGKNILNPALTGLLFIQFMFEVPNPYFSYSILLLPALILSIPFLKMRPFAGCSFIFGMAMALIISGDFSLENVLAYGLVFWGCLVLTDPVTVTAHPMIGSMISFLAGFAGLYIRSAPIVIIVGILIVNLVSYVVENSIPKSKERMRLTPKRRIHKTILFNSEVPLIDLTGEKESKEEEIRDLSVENSLERIKEKDVFGMGGAAFSTFEKIMAVRVAKAKNKNFIINGVECDPGLIHDQWLLQNEMDKIVKGIAFVCKCVNFTSVHLAVKNAEGIHGCGNIQINEISNKYPSGAERILISEVLNQQTPRNELPTSYGNLVLNVQTMYMIYNAVYRNKKADTRFITVSNLKEKDVNIVKVKLGMKIREVMDFVYPGTIYIFAGGGIMQSQLVEEEAIIDKKVNYIAAAAFPKYKESPQCSKCGSCSNNCPAGLKVNIIADFVDQGKINSTKGYKVTECISCGSCSYFCLAGRNLADRVKTAKEALNNQSIVI